MASPLFSEADVNFDPSRISPDARRTLDAANRALQKELEERVVEGPSVLEPDGIRAGYKIEVHFGPGRTSRAEYKALVLLMESGKHFHGGGDGQIYICMDHRPFEESTTPPTALPLLKAMTQKEPFRDIGCGHPIVSSRVALGRAFCDQCNRFWHAENLTGQIPFFGSTGELAEMVALLFRQLKMNADIYCKYDRTDIRYNICEKTHGFEKARKLRGMFIYPLKRILSDTSGGSTVQDRFKAFFSA